MRPRAAALVVAAATTLVGLPALGYGAGGTTIKLSARLSRFKASTQSEGAGQASTVTSTL